MNLRVFDDINPLAWCKPNNSFRASFILLAWASLVFVTKGIDEWNYRSVSESFLMTSNFSNYGQWLWFFFSTKNRMVFIIQSQITKEWGPLFPWLLLMMIIIELHATLHKELVTYPYFAISMNQWEFDKKFKKCFLLNRSNWMKIRQFIFQLEQIGFKTDSM